MFKLNWACVQTRRLAVGSMFCTWRRVASLYLPMLQRNISPTAGASLSCKYENGSVLHISASFVLRMRKATLIAHLTTPHRLPNFPRPALVAMPRTLYIWTPVQNISSWQRRALAHSPAMLVCTAILHICIIYEYMEEARIANKLSHSCMLQKKRSDSLYYTDPCVWVSVFI